jgi:haloacetate dehalogenase
VFENFVAETVDADGLPMFVRHAGSGPVVLLLHGHPRTSATWHRVAPALVEQGFTVVCPDLPGYGRSGKPEPAEDHEPHGKKAGARHLVAMMDALGHDRFAVVGHDRGSLFAFRLAMDHAAQVVRAVLVDCLPVCEHLDRITPEFATQWWHWFFFAQPEMPERVINADPDSWYHGDPQAMGAENYAEFRATMRDPDVVRGMLEEYRAGLTVDDRDERIDRVNGKRLDQPVLVLWTLRDDLEQLYGDPILIWRDWARDVTGHGIDSGHHVAELAPAELIEAVGEFLRPLRTPRSNGAAAPGRLLS